MEQKSAVSLYIRHPDSSVLLVQRPADDDDLANCWGLPASSLKKGETDQDAVLRTGDEKLSVQLSVIAPLKSGYIDRSSYRLNMTLYEASIISGIIDITRLIEGQTRYQNWKWGTLSQLLPAAKQGSLCSTLCLTYHNISFQ